MARWSLDAEGGAGTGGVRIDGNTAIAGEGR